MGKVSPVIERRFAAWADDVEVREADDGVLRFSGHAAVFDSPTDLGYFREQIAPGAFKRSIHNKHDVRFLFNHSPDSVMARTTNGTLRLSEDEQGLYVEADLDPTDWDVRRLAPKLRSGNVSQMSFAFRANIEDLDEEQKPPLRTLRDVQLFDVSPVTFPAYEATEAELVSVRDLLSVRPDLRELADESAANATEEDKVSPDESREEKANDSDAKDADAATAPPFQPSVSVARSRLNDLRRKELTLKAR